MRVVILLCALALAAPAAADAQQAPASPLDSASPVNLEPLLAAGTTEWMAAAGPAFGVVLFHSSRGHKYVLPSLSWGRILTGPIGPGVLRGRFQWSVEIVPLFGQYAPFDTFGAGVTPLHWRWNFDPHGRVAPFAELAGGLLWTRDPLPAQTTRANFTAHAAYGIRYFFRPQQALVVSYRLHHISNGNRLERNPGVNAHVIQIGMSFMRPR